MATKVKIQIDPTQKILLKRALNENGKGQQYFTKQVAKYANNYTPYLTGRLKDIDVEIQTSKIIYSAPYASKVYYTNKGTGRQGMAHGGLRGPKWIPRMWNQRGNEIVKSVAQYCGVRAK